MTQAGKFPVMGNVSYLSTGLVVGGFLFVCCCLFFFLMNSQNI